MKKRIRVLQQQLPFTTSFADTLEILPPELPLPEEVREVPLPAMRFDEIEQLGLAFQNRDAQALHYLISDKLKHYELGNKQKFIDNYLAYCLKLEKKHGSIYVQTVKGSCQADYCNYGIRGLSVSVHSVKSNKQLWHFNLVAEKDSTCCLHLQKCMHFKVNLSDV